MSNNVLVMTVKERKDLSRDCLCTMRETLLSLVPLYIVDASTNNPLTQVEIKAWYGQEAEYLENASYGIVAGWNRGMDKVWEKHPDADVWLVNNDVVFKRQGWLDRLSNRLNISPDVGVIGDYCNILFGHKFASGGVWGFNLARARGLAENGKILDEQLNFCGQDVDICIRMMKAGFEVNFAEGMEYGPDPYILHLESATMRTSHQQAELYKLREPERKRIIDKHGRKDYKEGYEGVDTP